MIDVRNLYVEWNDIKFEGEIRDQEDQVEDQYCFVNVIVI